MDMRTVAPVTVAAPVQQWRVVRARAARTPRKAAKAKDQGGLQGQGHGEANKNII